MLKNCTARVEKESQALVEKLVAREQAAAVHASQLKDYHHRLARAEESLSAADSHRDELQAKLSDYETELSSLRVAHGELAARHPVIQERNEELSRQLGQSQAKAVMMADLERRLQDLQHLLVHSQQERTDLEGQMGALHRELAHVRELSERERAAHRDSDTLLTQHLQAERDSSQALSLQLDQHREALTRMEAELDHLKAEKVLHLKARSELTEVNDQCRQLMEALDDASSQMRDLETLLSQERNKTTDLQAQLQQTRSECERLTVLASVHSDKARGLETAHATVTEENQKYQSELDEMRVSMLSLMEKATSVGNRVSQQDDLMSRLESDYEEARALLSQKDYELTQVKGNCVSVRLCCV